MVYRVLLVTADGDETKRHIFLHQRLSNYEMHSEGKTVGTQSI